MQIDAENAGDKKLLADVRNGERRALAKAITLVESTLPEHAKRAQNLIAEIVATAKPSVGAGDTPLKAGALRIGISGVPGVGKSTFIEALGLYLIAAGHKVAVLAVDPSSSLTGGSILGDKTRMEQLSLADAAFIRPSPSSGALGGVTDHTREAILLCEAAGYDIIIVETVGVGQSEIAVAAMTDLFVLMQLPNAGDDLQAIKKGIMELADFVVFNKADIDLIAAQRAVAQMRLALSMLRPTSKFWTPHVMSLSAFKQDGLAEFWQQVSDFRLKMQASGELAAKRQHQAIAWMNQQIDSALRQQFRQHSAVAQALPEISAAVENGSMTPTFAAQRLLALARQ
jgi:LAO/AO transport system kinase